MASIKIISGKRGWHLTVNGLYISHSFGQDIKAIECQHRIPYGATEWISLEAIRSFWLKYRIIIIHSTGRPFRSVWGQLIPLQQWQLN